jgi:N-terminal acetyltransferase B complex non-catalytic subunit
MARSQTLRAAKDQDLNGLVDSCPRPRYVYSISSIFEIYEDTDMTQAYRYRANLAAEKLMQIVDPASEKHGGNAADFLRLKQHVVSNGQNNSGSQLLTWSETLAKQTYDDMGFILREPCDKELWSEDDFQDKLDAHNKNLCEGLEQHVALVSGLHDVVPAFQNTLHALYIAHEVGRAVLNFSDYFARHGKEVHQKQIEASKQIAGIAQKLLQTVVDKCAVIKKGLDEGGWIDKVLESTLPDAQEGETSAVLVLRDLIDENFMEELAGLVVESWRDSIVGLSCLKASAKA